MIGAPVFGTLTKFMSWCWFFCVKGRALSEISLTLSADTVAALRKRVRFDSEADIAAFAADALRVYAELGALTRTPGTLMWHPEGRTPLRVRLPGDHPGAADNTTATPK